MLHATTHNQKAHKSGPNGTERERVIRDENGPNGETSLTVDDGAAVCLAVEARPAASHSMQWTMTKSTTD